MQFPWGNIWFKRFALCRRYDILQLCPNRVGISSWVASCLQRILVSHLSPTASSWQESQQTTRKSRTLSPQESLLKNLVQQKSLEGPTYPWLFPVCEEFLFDTFQTTLYVHVLAFGNVSTHREFNTCVPQIKSSGWSSGRCQTKPESPSLPHIARAWL